MGSGVGCGAPAVCLCVGACRMVTASLKINPSCGHQDVLLL
jgi:hypothetical protein